MGSTARMAARAGRNEAAVILKDLSTTAGVNGIRRLKSSASASSVEWLASRLIFALALRCWTATWSGVGMELRFWSCLSY